MRRRHVAQRSQHHLAVQRRSVLAAGPALKRAVLITNPFASRVGRSARGLKQALTRLEAGGVQVEVMATARERHGRELARAAVEQGVDFVIAHGGDGTIMEIAEGIAGTETPIGLLPAGTGNRLADNLHVSWNPLKAADIMIAGQTRRIDLGRMSSDGTEPRLFAVTAGCGFDAELMHNTPTAHKKALGVWAYTTSAITVAAGGVKRAKVKVEYDGGQSFEGFAAVVLVANCGNIVPYLKGFGPHIRPDDGMLDVIVLDAATFAGATRVAWRLMWGNPGSDGLVTYLRTKAAKITTEPVLAAQADGDAAGFAPMEAEIVEGGLTVLAPPV